MDELQLFRKDKVLAREEGESWGKRVVGCRPQKMLLWEDRGEGARREREQRPQALPWGVPFILAGRGLDPTSTASPYT